MNTEFIYFIIGESGSGKSTVANMLSERYGYKVLQSYTTRPKRNDNETGHIFITEEEYKQLPNKAAHCVYNNYYYCATKEQLEEANIYIVNADGIYNLMLSKMLDRDFRVIYITAPSDVREKRMQERKESTDSLKNRAALDSTLKEQNEWLADIKIENKNIETTVLKVLDFIKECETYKKDMIYISHPFNSDKNNLEEINKILLNNIEEFPEFTFISPVNMYGFAYDLIPYDDGLSLCIDLLKHCSQCWVYGDYKSSTGCKAEIEYCERYNIPIKYVTEY